MDANAYCGENSLRSAIKQKNQKQVSNGSKIPNINQNHYKENQQQPAANQQHSSQQPPANQQHSNQEVKN